MVAAMTNRKVLYLGLALLIGTGAIAAAAPAPQAGIPTLKALPVVVSKPYNEDADANAAVNAALAEARTSNKRVLIDLGGNWCPDCVVLSNIMRLPNVAPFIAANYEVVEVDVGRINRNLQIPARFGITKRPEGVPSVLIVDADGKLLNQGHTEALSDAHNMEPQAIVDWLASWTQ
jgi:thiol:disulfide interchange protein